MLGLKTIGIIFVVLFACSGCAIGTFKVPEIGGFEFGKKVGGQPIDDVIRRWITFKRKNGKIYV